MTTPIPITAPKKGYHITAPDRNTVAGAVVSTTYNLLAGTYQMTAGGYDLVVPGKENVCGYGIAAPKRNYNIVTPERDNG